jgi:hypothetical protein
VVYTTVSKDPPNIIFREDEKFVRQNHRSVMQNRTRIWGPIAPPPNPRSILYDGSVVWGNRAPRSVVGTVGPMAAPFPFWRRAQSCKPPFRHALNVQQQRAAVEQRTRAKPLICTKLETRAHASVSAPNWAAAGPQQTPSREADSRYNIPATWRYTEPRESTPHSYRITHWYRFNLFTIIILYRSILLHCIVQ